MRLRRPTARQLIGGTLVGLALVALGYGREWAAEPVRAGAGMVAPSGDWLLVYHADRAGAEKVARVFLASAGMRMNSQQNNVMLLDTATGRRVETFPVWDIPRLTPGG